MRLVDILSILKMQTTLVAFGGHWVMHWFSIRDLEWCFALWAIFMT